MTTREVYEYTLIELNKVEAPSCLLEDWNYYINKAILSYVNKRYNIYDMNQQNVDDLRVLSRTVTVTGLVPTTDNKLQGATYTGNLPLDYFHLLNCVCEFTPTKNFKCYKMTQPIYKGAKRLHSDAYPQIINNYYLKPSMENPYWYIHNVVEPTIDVNQIGVPDEIRTTGSRITNTSIPKIQIRYGTDNSLFTLTSIDIDYIVSPQKVRLTQTQLDTDEDTSPILEFPDFVCIDILKELVALLMENASDPRLNSNIPINQVTAPPGTGQIPQKR